LSADGKLINLAETQWLHIKQRHPEMVNRLQDIENAIVNPTFRTSLEGNIIKFYKFIKSEKVYIVTVVKITNGEGFVITAYKAKKTK